MKKSDDKIHCYVEYLYHFRCGSCNFMWSTDDARDTRGSAYCPRCGKEGKIVIGDS